MLSWVKYLSHARRLFTAYWRQADIDLVEQAWAGFMLLLILVVFMFAWPTINVFNGIVLLLFMLLLARLAWQWRAMQISVVMMVLLSVTVLLSNTASLLEEFLLPAISILLLTGFVLAILVELGKMRLSRIHSRYLCWSAVVIGILLLVLQGADSFRLGQHYVSLPLTRVDAFLILSMLGMVFIYLSFERTHSRIPASFIGLLPALLMSLYLTADYVLRGAPQATLPDAILAHNLLLVHVPAMITAFALLLSTVGFALLRLLSDYSWFRTRHNQDVLETVQTQLEDYLYQLLSLAVIVMGVGLLAGMLWSNLAWGHYWLAEPKQVMSLAVWLYYLAGLHFRLQKGMPMRPFAWWCVAGLPLLLLSLLGTNLWPQGLHSFGSL